MESSKFHIADKELRTRAIYVIYVTMQFGLMF